MRRGSLTGYAQGEISALINLARTLGGECICCRKHRETLKHMVVGFGVAYFQVPWATKSGALVVMGHRKSTRLNSSHRP